MPLRWDSSRVAATRAQAPRRYLCSVLDTCVDTPHVHGMAERDWYSTQQVAQMVGMTSQWVRRQIDAGRLNARYFDGAGRRTYRIHRTDLREFLRRFGRDSVDDGGDLLGPRRR